MEEVANAIGRKPHTLYRWLDDPEFQAAVIRGIRSLAILTLAQYLKHGVDPKAGQAALATLRWLGAGKPGTKPRQSREEAAGEDETDLDEFSEEQLKRLKGDG